MNNNDIFSDSNKYKVTIEKDEDGDQTTYTIYSSVERDDVPENRRFGGSEPSPQTLWVCGDGETKHEKDKYEIVKVINVETGNIIYTYKQFNSHSPINKFVKLGGQEWWFGGRDYMLKLFVNCETGQVFDDPNKREFSNAYKNGSEFIWTGPLIVSPNGHFIFVNGCMWSFPSEWRLYYIRNITTNTMSNNDHLPIPEPCYDDDEGGLIRQISLYHYLTVKEFDKDDERYEYEDYWLGDDEMFTFEFVTDDKITVKYYHNKEWKYFNTIDLSQYRKYISR
jgi:hypothetical protein